jgi:hypothetical protein
MAQAHYQITLSLDGNHQVSVTGDDPVAVKEGLAWARGIYLKLKERSEQQAVSPAAASETPECAIHHQPMTLVTGKKGQFWSCHQKLEDGITWSPYKPPR